MCREPLKHLRSTLHNSMFSMNIDVILLSYRKSLFTHGKCTPQYKSFKSPPHNYDAKIFPHMMLTLILTYLITAATTNVTCCRSTSCNPIGQLLVRQSCCHGVDEWEALCVDDVPYLGLPWLVKAVDLLTLLGRVDGEKIEIEITQVLRWRSDTQKSILLLFTTLNIISD